MDSKLRTCVICKQAYKFCNHCQEDVGKPMWMMAFCSQNCHDIYATASSFEDGRIDANTAKEQLDKLDLSKIDNFGGSYKKTINKIVDGSSSINKVEVQTVDETSIVEEIKEAVGEDNEIQTEEINDNTEEEKSIKKSRTRRAKNVE